MTSPATRPKPRLSLFTLFNEIENIWKAIRRLQRRRAAYIYYRHATYSQSIPTGASTPITAFTTFQEQPNDTDVYGTNFMLSGVATIQIDGIYTFHFQTDNAAGTATSRNFMGINRVRSGVTQTIARADRSNVNITAEQSTTATRVYLLAGDTVSFSLFQASGAAVVMTGFITVTHELP